MAGRAGTALRSGNGLRYAPVASTTGAYLNFAGPVARNYRQLVTRPSARLRLIERAGWRRHAPPARGASAEAAGGEGVAAARVAALVPGTEPLLPLRRRAVGELALVDPTPAQMGLDPVVADPAGDVEAVVMSLGDVGDEPPTVGVRGPWWRSWPRPRRSSRPAVPAAPIRLAPALRLILSEMPGNPARGARTRGPARTPGRTARRWPRTGSSARRRTTGRCRRACRPGSRTAHPESAAPQPVAVWPVKKTVRDGCTGCPVGAEPRPSTPGSSRCRRRWRSPSGRWRRRRCGTRRQARCCRPSWGSSPGRGCSDRPATHRSRSPPPPRTLNSTTTISPTSPSPPPPTARPPPA